MKPEELLKEHLDWASNCMLQVEGVDDYQIKGWRYSVETEINKKVNQAVDYFADHLDAEFAVQDHQPFYTRILKNYRDEN